jgi:hypothetical protein
MTCDRVSFHVEVKLDVREGGEPVFEREWKLSFPRDHV